MITCPPDKANEKTPPFRRKAINYKGPIVTKDWFEKYNEEKQKKKKKKKE